MFHLFVKIAVLGVCFSGVYGTCYLSDVERCIKPITDLRTQLGIPDDVEYFPIEELTITQLEDDYCVEAYYMKGIPPKYHLNRPSAKLSHLKTSAQCLASLSPCSQVEEATFKGLNDAAKYLCDDTLETYKTYHDCVSQSTVTNGLISCSETLTRTSSTADTASELCGDINANFACIKNAVSPSCGANAALWYVDYALTSQRPLMNLIDCSGASGIYGSMLLASLSVVLSWYFMMMD